MGSGANGRVIRLRSGKVLNVVVGKMSESVEREFNSMKDCLSNDEVNAVMFPIDVDSYRRGSIQEVAFAGYMLAYEGVQISPPIATDIKRKMAEALYGLHAKGILHRDPRIQNALLLNGEVKWIDFRQCDFVTTFVNRQRDVEVLLQSLGINVIHVREKIINYSEYPSVEILCDVICP